MNRFLFALTCGMITVMLLISCGDSSTSGNNSITMYDLSVSISPDGAGTISSTGSYEAGKSVNVKAEANEGYVFSNWTGDVESSENPLSFTIDQDYNLTANFEAKTYALTVKTDGEGTVEEKVLQKATDYEYGTKVELTAKPANNWEFLEWRGDITGSTNPAEITVDSEKEVTAVFNSTEPKTVVYQQGTIFLFPDMINDSDPTRYQSLSYTGRAEAEMYDRRVEAWVTVNAYIFEATFEGGETVQVEVNPEFNSEANATDVAEKYLPAIGQIPAVLHKDLDEIWIHKGNKPFGGGNNSLLIHDDYGDTYIQDNILAETFMHEATHTSLDANHATSTGWKDAQRKDPSFISQYAMDNTEREDLAESFAAYVAVELRSNRITQDDIDTVNTGIPNRITYLKNQSFDMYPLTSK